MRASTVASSRRGRWRFAKLAVLATIVLGLVPIGFQTPSVARAASNDIIGPAGSERFGTQVAFLSNGNLVVSDPLYDEGGDVDVGAVYLYNGQTRALISVLKGATPNDGVGSGGITVLGTGNFVIGSPNWTNGVIQEAGAATWASGTTGITGTISSANSLVGTNFLSRVGQAIKPLSNGNYLVISSSWGPPGPNPTTMGAVTWGDGSTGVKGSVSASNSLVGSNDSDQVGGGLVVELSNGNYVVASPNWKHGAEQSVGAVTWGDGTTGVRGAVSATNSLVGSTADDKVGFSCLRALSNGNYLVCTPGWDNGGNADLGAVTWGNGTTGVKGTISASNSLVGSTAGDNVGDVVTLSNGNYVVGSSDWDNGAITDAGAVTWGNGTTGVKGTISATNSLVGSTAGDKVGVSGVVALSNGNYVVRSHLWNNGATTDVGAVTWGDGTTGVTGAVSGTNSLIGSTSGDQVGSDGVTALTNGNYVVRSPWWANGGPSGYPIAGAATWGNGTTGITGTISETNSLVGSYSLERVSDDGVVALTNGNYVVLSKNSYAGKGAATWGNGTTGISGSLSSANSLVGSISGDMASADIVALPNGNYVVYSQSWNLNRGAVAWGNGTTGVKGTISTSNSLVGSDEENRIGTGVTALSNGNYVVRSPWWDNGATTDVGAVTWVDGTTGLKGIFVGANSVIGSTSGDQVGGSFLIALSNGNYVIRSPLWDDGGTADVGAITWARGTSSTMGVVSAANSLIGRTTNDLQSGFTLLSDGNYVLRANSWDNGSNANAGAIIPGLANAPLVGTLNASNSVRGTAPSGGLYMVVIYDAARRQLAVGRPADNIVTIFALAQQVFIPLLQR